jgi:hypothetical protein
MIAMAHGRHAGRRGPGPRLWWARRIVIVAVLAAQAAALAAAYGTPHKVFGWQMFPESSEWTADIVRIEADGSRHPISEPWPGGYRWADLVDARGLDTPGARKHAAYGLESTIDLLDAALEWVAANTPRDGRTVALEAVVTVWDNGRDPATSILSAPRDRESSP